MSLDLHAHLLWQIDDGPQSEGASVEMVRRLIDLGFGGAAPSPHGHADPGRCRARLSALREALDRAGLCFELYENTENALTPEVIAEIRAGRGRMLARTHYFLIELPFWGPLPALANILGLVSSSGLRAIIAHPERSAHFAETPGAAIDVHRAGGLLQLDLGSLVGVYGRTAQRTARALLDGDLFDVAASDMHCPADARWIAKALRALEEICGPERAARLLRGNPRRIVLDERLV